MYLGLDLGTSSLKALLIDDNQQILGSASAPLTVERLHPGWSEQDPDSWISATRVALAELAKTHAGDLAKVRGLSATWGGNDIGGRLMAALEAATPLPADELPARDDRKPGLGKEGSLVADLLKLLLKIRSRDIDVASKLLARSDELEALAAGVRTGLPMLEGWRFDQFGRDALDLVEGRLAFAVQNGKLKMTRAEDAA